VGLETLASTAPSGTAGGQRRCRGYNGWRFDIGVTQQGQGRLPVGRPGRTRPSSNCLNNLQTDWKEFDQKIFPCSKNLK
jgi:hypothetical protein